MELILIENEKHRNFLHALLELYNCCIEDKKDSIIIRYLTDEEIINILELNIKYLKMVYENEK